MKRGEIADRLMLGPQRRQRWMMRQLRELDRVDAGFPTRRGDRDRVRRRIGAAVAGGAVVVGGFLVLPRVAELVPDRDADTSGYDSSTSRPPLGHPPEVPHGRGTFAFLATQPRSTDPVAYDPCRKIEYAVNTNLGPRGGDAIIDDAVRQVSRATGLVFVRRPDTTEHPALGHSTTFDGEPRVVIDWSSAAAVPDLLGDTAGVGGSASVRSAATGESYYVSGGVALDAIQLGNVLHQPGGAERVRAVVMHELGHVVGLDHVDDRDELMYPETTRTRDLGPGDREGLAALGSGRCF